MHVEERPPAFETATLTSLLMLGIGQRIYLLLPGFDRLDRIDQHRCRQCQAIARNKGRNQLERDDYCDDAERGQRAGQKEAAKHPEVVGHCVQDRVSVGSPG